MEEWKLATKGFTAFMILAYSDPFEKYRALLFEYAHTLGLGVEAFTTDLYLKARRCDKSPVGMYRVVGW